MYPLRATSSLWCSTMPSPTFASTSPTTYNDASPRPCRQVQRSPTRRCSWMCWSSTRFWLRIASPLTIAAANCGKLWVLPCPLRERALKPVTVNFPALLTTSQTPGKRDGQKEPPGSGADPPRAGRALARHEQGFRRSAPAHPPSAPALRSGSARECWSQRACEF